MAKQFRLLVYTQEKLVLDQQVTSVIAPGEEGYFGVLADHAPLIATLGSGIVTIKTDTTERKARLSGGFMEVASNMATILADSFEDITKAA